MEFLNFYKVNSLPVEQQGNSLFFLPSSVDGFLEIAITNKEGNKVLKTLSHSDVEAIVVAKTSNVPKDSITKVIEFEATEVLRIEHNLNTLNYSYSITNNKGDHVWPDNDSDVDENGFTVNFTEAEAGTIFVIFHVNV